VKALVTGATGFVGAAVARALGAAGWQVRALVRAGSDRSNLQPLAVEAIEGDLADASSLERALAGCEGLFHVAADYRLGARHPEQLYRTNVDGTRNILSAARTARVPRIVYTSSVATIGIPADGSPGEEGSPVALSNMIGHYKRSKFLAEEVARDAAREGLSVVIVNPSTPVGPGDIKPTPTGQLVLDAAAGRMPAYVDTGLNIVHVDDVAAGHLLAFERGRAGERYILGGEDMTLQIILQEIARIAHAKPPSIRLPYAVVLPVAYFAEAFAWVSGRSGRVTLEGVRMSRKRMFFCSGKAVAELGYRWRPPLQAFEDALRWFRERGMLSPQLTRNIGTGS
jgi:dihydroflavonol-4-reductase